jgi:hypothetical protein
LLGHLQSGRAHATGPGVDQYRFPLRELAEGKQGFIGGQIHFRHGRCRLETPGLGNAHGHVGVEQRFFRVTADGGCSLVYTTNYQGVAAGRVWGEITCPKVTNSGAGVACQAVAQFRFENCDQ